MQLGVDVHVALVTALTVWSAQHNVSVGAVVAKALTEFMLDCDAHLLDPPEPELRSLLGRARKGRSAA